MKRFIWLLPLLLVSFLAMGAVNTNILQSAYDRSTGRLVLPTNASFGGLAIGTNKASITNGIHIRPTKTGTDYLMIDDTNGTARLRVGVFPGSPSLAGVWLGEIAPSAANWSIVGNGTDTYLGASFPSGIIYFYQGGYPIWKITPHLLAETDATYRIGSPGANRPLSIDVSGYGTFGGVLQVSTPSATPFVAYFGGLQAADTQGKVIAFRGGTDGTTVKGYIGYGFTGAGAATVFADELANSLSMRSEGVLHLGSGSEVDMTISTAGNVGIGTNAPASALHVVGEVRGTTFNIVGATNQVIFGATNPAPASVVAPVKWISVQVSGEAAVYRLPLYQ